MSPNTFIKKLTHLLIFVPVAILGVVSSVSAAGTNMIVNGSFSVSGGGWSGTTSSGCDAGVPSMGVWTQNALTFSYVENTVSQTVVIPSPSSVSFTYYAINRAENYINGKINVTISSQTQSFSSGQFTPARTNTQYGIGLETTIPNETVTVSITGSDGGLFWAGCYGPTLTNAVLMVTPVAPVVPLRSVWVQILEGQSQTITAPSGSVFTEVFYASYGNPTGSNGLYENGWCHAQSSVAKVSAAVVGKTSATLVASNGVFGDPCGGTYKRLYATIVYSAPTVTTTSTTTTSTSTTSTSTTSTTTTIPETTTTVVIPTTIETTTTMVVTTTSVPVQTTIPKPPAVTENAPKKEEIATTEKVTASEKIASIDTSKLSSTETAKVIEDAISQVSSPAELQNVVTTILDKELSNEQFDAVITEVFSADLSEDEFSAVLDAVFEKELTDEQFLSVIDSVVTKEISDGEFSAIVEILSGDNVTQEQISTAVDALIATDIDASQATELATSAEVIMAIDGEQATEIFAVVDIGNIAPEDAQKLVSAVQEAKIEVREAFETEINVFDGAVDTYVPLGSSISVTKRRVVIAAAAATAAAGAAAASVSSKR